MNKCNLKFIVVAGSQLRTSRIGVGRRRCL